MNCGEIFVADFENPNFHGKLIQEITHGQKCPRCSYDLSKSLQAYPGTFRTENGDVGHFVPERIPATESEIVEFYEILEGNVSG